MKSAAHPLFNGFQSLPPSVVSKTPPLDMPIYMCFASRGSILIECILGPSGVPSCPPPHHVLRIGWSLKPATPFHVLPPSSVLNNPWGDDPPYHTFGSFACPGVSQNVWLSTRPVPSGLFGKAGG